MVIYQDDIYLGGANEGNFQSKTVYQREYLTL